MTRPASFDAGVVALRGNLRSFALSLTKDRERADDLVQETMLKAFRFHHHYTEGTNLGAWLFTMLRNEHHSRFRKDSRVVDDPDGFATASLWIPGEQEDYIRLQDVLDQLESAPPFAGEALLLTAQGESYEAVAKHQNTEAGTIKSRVNRARAHLREMVA